MKRSTQSVVASVGLALSLLLGVPLHSVHADTFAATAEAVVQQMVEQRGDAYAGSCRDTRSPQDIGKVCATLVAERGTLRAYLAGRTFSEYSVWLFVREDSAGWTTAGARPLNFFAASLDIPWPD